MFIVDEFNDSSEDYSGSEENRRKNEQRAMRREERLMREQIIPVNDERTRRDRELASENQRRLFNEQLMRRREIDDMIYWESLENQRLTQESDTEGDLDNIEWETQTIPSQPRSHDSSEWSSASDIQLSENIDRVKREENQQADEYIDIKINETIRIPQNKPVVISLTSMCFDIINGIEISIKTALEEDNIIFIFYSDANVLSVAIPSTQLIKSFIKPDLYDYIIYPCLSDTGFIPPTNYDILTPLFDIKKLVGFGDLIKLYKMDFTKKIFVFQKTQQTIISTVSYNVIFNKTNYVSARHCQAGQHGNIYEEIHFVIKDNKKRKSKTRSKSRKRSKSRSPPKSPTKRRRTGSH